MNNLTPLQEVASRIYAAKIASGAWNPTAWGSIVSEFLYVNEPDVMKKMQEDSVSEARKLLEATKPKPLEWYQKNEDSPNWYSKGGEFKIIAHFANDYNLCLTVGEQMLTPSFDTLAEAKQFAEHIRTR
jgi:hypothetical protein